MITGAEESLSGSLRNVYLQEPNALLPPSRGGSKAWWQVLGFVWLAWWMHDRNDENPDETGPTNVTKFRR